MEQIVTASGRTPQPDVMRHSESTSIAPPGKGVGISRGAAMSQSIKITNLGPDDVVVNEWLQETAGGEGHNTKRHDLCPNESVIAMVSSWRRGVTVMEMAGREEDAGLNRGMAVAVRTCRVL